MKFPIEKIEVSERYGSSVIEVTDINGARLFYLFDQGTYIPGRPWISLLEGDQHRVHFFLPFGDDRPRILKIECDHADG